MIDTLVNTFIYEIPDKLSTNKLYAGTHWTKRKKIKDLYTLTLRPLLKACEIEPVEDYPVDLEFIFLFGKGRVLDSSNCSGMGKVIEDILVTEGILEDDSSSYVRTVSYSSAKNRSSKKNVVVVNILKTPSEHIAY